MAKPLKNMMDELKMPLISSSCQYASLSQGGKFFLRTISSYLSWYQALVDVTLWMGNTVVGNVLSEGWIDNAQVFVNALKSNANNITSPCSTLTIYTSNPKHLGSELDKLYGAGCRFFATFQDHAATVVFREAQQYTRIFGPGVGWVTQNWTIEQMGFRNGVAWSGMNGWLCLDAYVDTEARHIT